MLHTPKGCRVFFHARSTLAGSSCHSSTHTEAGPAGRLQHVRRQLGQHLSALHAPWPVSGMLARCCGCLQMLPARLCACRVDFFRVDRGFVAQTSDVLSRRQPLDARQQACTPPVLHTCACSCELVWGPGLQARAWRPSPAGRGQQEGASGGAAQLEARPAGPALHGAPR